MLKFKNEAGKVIYKTEEEVEAYKENLSGLEVIIIPDLETGDHYFLCASE